MQMIEDRISNLKGRSTEIMQSSEHHDISLEEKLIELQEAVGHVKSIKYT